MRATNPPRGPTGPSGAEPPAPPSDPVIDALWARVEAALDRIEPGLAELLGAPASAEALSALAALGAPPSLCALYARHDGQTADLDPLFGDAFFVPIQVDRNGPGVVAPPSLLGEHQRMRELATGMSGAAAPAPVEGPMQPLWASAQWLPFAVDPAGGMLCVDLAPADGGTVGQILGLRPEGARQVRFPDPAALLDALAAELEAGQRRLRRWMRLPGGRRVRDGFVEVRLVGAGALQPGERLPLGPSAPGLCLVGVHAPTVAPRARRTDTTTWLAVDEDGPQPGPWRALDLRVDGPGDWWVRRAHGCFGLGGPALRAAGAYVVVQLDLHADDQAPLVDAGAVLSLGRPLRATAMLGAGVLSGAALETRARARAMLGAHAEAEADFSQRIAAGGDATGPRVGVDVAEGGAAQTLAALRFERAVQRRARGDMQGALDDLRQAISSAVDPWPARTLRVRTLLEMGRTADALDEADAALGALGAADAAIGAERGDRGRALILRAEVHEALAAWDQGLADLEAAIDGRLDEDELPVAKAALHRMREARMRSREGGELRGVVDTTGVLSGRCSPPATTPEGVVSCVDLSFDEAAAGVTVELSLPHGRSAVRLPPGGGHGTRLAQPGLLPDGAPLILELRLPMPPAVPGVEGTVLRLDRWDLWVELPIRAEDARAGGARMLPGLRGPERVVLPPGLGADAVHRIVGLGLPRGKSARGDLVVQLRALR